MDLVCLFLNPKQSIKIIALGGVGFSIEAENTLLDSYILKQSGKENPKFDLFQLQVEIQRIIKKQRKTPSFRYWDISCIFFLDKVRLLLYFL
jgi:hypothetical protein